MIVRKKPQKSIDGKESLLTRQNFGRNVFINLEKLELLIKSLWSWLCKMYWLYLSSSISIFLYLLFNIYFRFDLFIDNRSIMLKMNTNATQNNHKIYHLKCIWPLQSVTHIDTELFRFEKWIFFSLFLHRRLSVWIFVFVVFQSASRKQKTSQFLYLYHTGLFRFYLCFLI